MRVDKHQPDASRTTIRIVLESRKHAEQVVAVCFQANRDQVVPRSFANRIGKIRIRQRHAIPLAVLTLLLCIQANVLHGPDQFATPFADKSLEPCGVNVIGVGRQFRHIARAAVRVLDDVDEDLGICAER